MSPKRYWIILFGIILFGMVIRAYSVGWYYGGDDRRWTIAAAKFGESEGRELRSVYYERIVWSALLHVWGKLFGLSLETTGPLMFGLSAITTFLVGMAGRRFYDDATSLLAAFLFTVHPINVVYDVQTLPDGLAVVFLAALLWVIAGQLSGLTQRGCAAAGFFTMIIFSTKIYLILAGISFLALQWGAREPIAVRVRMFGAFLAGCAAALLVSTGLCYYDTGVLFPFFDSVGEYQSIYTALVTESGSPVRQSVIAILSRLIYVKWLVVTPGLFSGLASVLGLLAIVVFIRDSRTRILGSFIVVIVAFLMWMPLQWRPLVFVTESIRYLTAILAPLSILSAAMLMRFRALTQERGHRTLVIGLSGVLLCHTIACTDDFANEDLGRGWMLEMQALPPLLRDLHSQGVKTVRFPLVYRERIPESFLAIGPKLEFFDCEEPEEKTAFRQWLHGDRSGAVYIPRNRATFSTVRQAYAAGAYAPIVRRDDTLNGFLELRQANPYETTVVRIPASAHRQWLARLGYSTVGHHVAWVIREPSK